MNENRSSISNELDLIAMLRFTKQNWHAIVLSALMGALFSGVYSYLSRTKFYLFTTSIISVSETTKASMQASEITEKMNTLLSSAQSKTLLNANIHNMGAYDAKTILINGPEIVHSGGKSSYVVNMSVSEPYISSKLDNAVIVTLNQIVDADNSTTLMKREEATEVEITELDLNLEKIRNKSSDKKELLRRVLFEKNLDIAKIGFKLFDISKRNSQITNYQLNQNLTRLLSRRAISAAESSANMPSSEAFYDRFDSINHLLGSLNYIKLIELEQADKIKNELLMLEKTYSQAFGELQALMATEQLAVNRISKLRSGITVLDETMPLPHFLIVERSDSISPVKAKYTKNVLLFTIIGTLLGFFVGLAYVAVPVIGRKLMSISD